MSGLSEMQVSKFCKNGNITVKALLRLISACDDLSLDFLFFGYGEILKKKDGMTINYGTVNNHEQNDIVGNNSTVIKSTLQGGSIDSWELILEKDRIIQENYNVISLRDASISKLIEQIASLSERLSRKVN